MRRVSKCWTNQSYVRRLDVGFNDGTVRWQRTLRLQVRWTSLQGWHHHWEEAESLRVSDEILPSGGQPFVQGQVALHEDRMPCYFDDILRKYIERGQWAWGMVVADQPGYHGVDMGA